MTDPRPRPQYGEYADVPPPPPQPVPAAEAAPAPTARPRRTWDVILTTALLLWGVADVVTGFPQFARLGALVRQVAEVQGWPALTSTETADQVGATLNVIRLVLLVVAIVVALLLIGRRRLAFWVPLAAGVLAMLVTVIGVVAVLLGDPGFTEFLQDPPAR
ncbi:MAG TPA: DUF6264 family protein [Rhodoglobus sp.]|nr:DUF6264 family protein [Rhodoglobus sp.]